MNGNLEEETSDDTIPSHWLPLDRVLAFKCQEFLLKIVNLYGTIAARAQADHMEARFRILGTYGLKCATEYSKVEDIMVDPIGWLTNLGYYGLWHETIELELVASLLKPLAQTSHQVAKMMMLLPGIKAGFFSGQDGLLLREWKLTYKDDKDKDFRQHLQEFIKSNLCLFPSRNQVFNPKEE